MHHELKLIPKLTLEHLHLNPYSIMNVRLATQVLSKTVANILYSYYPQETHKTAEFCEFMDNFFDLLNVRNQTEGDRKKKEFLKPFTSPNDPQFDWLKDVFLPYLKDWKHSTECRNGNFYTKCQR